MENMTGYPLPIDVFGVETISGALEHSASTSGHGIALIDRHLRDERLPYDELAQGARSVAAALLARGLEPGDRVAILSQVSSGMLMVLFGVWRAGMIPIILPFPRRVSDLDSFLLEMAARLDLSGARAFVLGDALAAHLPTGDLGVAPVLVSELLTHGGPAPRPDLSGPDDVALIQFTSGATGRSRAVTLTHRHILNNLAASAVAAQHDPDRDIVVSWLPLFHDMGLIGMLIGAVATGMQLALQPTEEFLARPGSWIDAISRFGGSITAAPNFAFGLAAREMTARPRDLDLSSLRVLVNGAEPINFKTMAAFQTAAKTFGAQPRAMCPAYGLAEACLAATFSRPTEPTVVEWVSRPGLEKERRVFSTGPEDPDGKALVACGGVLPGVEQRIVDDAGGDLNEGNVGEILVRSPALMIGYWRNEEATAEALQDGWLHTGDLGYMGGNGLVVCGRIKDVIFLGGQTLFAEDYEFAAEQVPGVRSGNVIAFAIPDIERMVVVAETKVAAEDAQGVAEAVLERLWSSLARGPQEVVVVPPGNLPKTSSGKRQRQACRRLFEGGDLPVLAVARRGA